MIETNFLTSLFHDAKIVIDAVDGKELLSEANDVFSPIDPNFVNYGANEPGSATEKTPVMVYEMTKDVTFTQMFGSLNADLDKLCFTQAQIKSFAKKHRDKLHADGYGTFFLFKSKNHFFVACVVVYLDGTLYVRVFQFEDLHVWHADHHRRLVVPQLAV